MKKFLMLMLMVSPLFLASSCGSDDEGKEDSLVGTKWECAKSGELYTFEFTSSTMCKLTAQEKELVFTDYGYTWDNVTSYRYYTWAKKGNVVTLTPTETSSLVPLICTITGSTMSVVNSSTNAVIYTCTRIE